MQGDFSRIRFNPAKEYTAVLKQQGRVDLDSDANEQRAIDSNLRETTNVDVIGRYGGPEDSAGFAISIEGEQIWISPGRYYVEGILVENPRRLSYDEQPYLIDSDASAADLLRQLTERGSGATLQFVLEVWQRMVTALDDPCLLEPALGQADTTTRVQTVWRVVGSVITPRVTSNLDQPRVDLKAVDTVAKLRFRNPSALGGAISQLSPCCQTMYDRRFRVDHNGQMRAELAQGGGGCGCQPNPAAGYQGLENQLYRVEIHKGGDLGTATFKWSRENGSVVVQVTAVGINSKTITIASLGPDANLGFQAGQWVELSDDSNLFGTRPNQPGTLYQIDSISPATLQVTMTTPVLGIDTSRHAKMRRWDQTAASATSSGIALSNAPVPLENGIEVAFRKGQYEPGDYWTIPARTANGSIDWPPCDGDGKLYQPANYMHVHAAPLACVQLRGRREMLLLKGQATASNSKFAVSDCRLLFPPLTAIEANTAPEALHVSAVTWPNDDVITVDALLAKGLSVTFDQPTTCPWGGGNFQVQLEAPYTSGERAVIINRSVSGTPRGTFEYPPSTDCFIRTFFALDPPWGVVVSGKQVSWMTAVSSSDPVNYAAYTVFEFLNTLLRWQQPIGFGRVRIRLIGSSVYASGNKGNIYLDGQSFGNTGSRVVDESPCVSLTVPSGDSLAVSDYESWFYLAPTVYVTSVVIKGINNGKEVTVTALKVIVNTNNQVTGLQIGESAVVTELHAVITLSYPPVAPTKVNLAFNPVSGPTASSVASIASSVEIPAGQLTHTTPITILSNPGAKKTDVVSLAASVPILQSSYPAPSPPQLSIAGTAPPPIRIIKRPLPPKKSR